MHSGSKRHHFKRHDATEEVEAVARSGSGRGRNRNRNRDRGTGGAGVGEGQGPGRGWGPQGSSRGRVRARGGGLEEALETHPFCLERWGHSHASSLLTPVCNSLRAF